MEIRDTRNGEWHWVNNAVLACPHIKPYDKVVYSALCTFANCEEIRPDFGLIAERASVSIRRAKKGISNLIEVGFVEKIVGGGRGKANVYNLPKAIKGCKLCTVSKECTEKPERVQDTTLNRASCAPQIDKELNKEIDKVYNLNDMIELFKDVNPSYKQLFKHSSQRNALSRLIKEHGEEKIIKILNVLPKTNQMKYAPIITTPLQLETKLGVLLAFIKQESGESRMVKL